MYDDALRFWARVLKETAWEICYRVVVWTFGAVIGIEILIIHHLTVRLIENYQPDCVPVRTYVSEFRRELIVAERCYYKHGNRESYRPWDRDRVLEQLKEKGPEPGELEAFVPRSGTF
jgi:hypothetical protein